MAKWSVAQGMYSYLRNGGQLCPNLRDDLSAEAEKGLEAYIRDFGEDGVWLEDNSDCEELQEWVNR